MSALELVPEKRFDLLHRAEDLFMQDLGAIPIYTRGGAFLINENVKGVAPHFSGIQLMFSFAEKEEA